jgi:protease-4
MTKSTKWFLGILAVLALFALGFTFLIVYFINNTSPSERTETVTIGSGDRIAVIDLKGVITSSEDVVRQLKKYRAMSSVKAIVLHIDSPGGGVVASQEMYEEVRSTREGGKPVIVAMGSLAASGGYYVSCGATRIVANRGTLTGSIGVISEFLQVKDALAKLGISETTIKAGKLKDAGSPTKNMTEDDRVYFQNLMDEVHRQFMDVVARERKLSPDKVRGLADGRVYTGVKAVELGLVDTLGTYEDAIRIAAGIAGITGEPSIVRERRRQTWWDSMFGSAGETLRDIKQELLDRPALSYRFAGSPY